MSSFWLILLSGIASLEKIRKKNPETYDSRLKDLCAEGEGDEGMCRLALSLSIVQITEKTIEKIKIMPCLAAPVSFSPSSPSLVSTSFWYLETKSRWAKKRLDREVRGEIWNTSLVWKRLPAHSFQALIINFGSQSLNDDDVRWKSCPWLGIDSNWH